MENYFQASPHFARLTWEYSSGFFDGEGGFMVGFGTSRRVITIVISLAQKSREVLELMRLFLAKEGIFSVIKLMTDGTHTLRVMRINDIVLMISKMRLVVKYRQAQAVSSYLGGKLTGGQLLQLLQQEHLKGRRKSNIPATAFAKFPLTRPEAKALGQRNGSAAGATATEADFHDRIMRVYPKLPMTFNSRDLSRLLKVGIDAGLRSGKHLERIGLATSTKVRRKGTTMYRFTKVHA